MNNENMQVVEINGIKMEVDMRTAKRVDSFKVGDPVKMLLLGGTDNEVKNGVIVGFEQFEKLPTIVVAYLSSDYFSSGLKFAYINSDSSDKYEMIACHDDTMLTLDKESVVRKMNKEIEDSHNKLKDLEAQKEYFLDRFGAYFPEAKETA